MVHEPKHAAKTFMFKNIIFYVLKILANHKEPKIISPECSCKKFLSCKYNCVWAPYSVRNPAILLFTHTDEISKVF